MADIEHPLVSVVGELQSHFSSSLASQNTIWNMDCTSFSFRRRCRNRRKNIRVEKENRETKRRKKKKGLLLLPQNWETATSGSCLKALKGTCSVRVNVASNLVVGMKGKEAFSTTKMHVSHLQSSLSLCIVHVQAICSSTGDWIFRWMPC